MARSSSIACPNIPSRLGFSVILLCCSAFSFLLPSIFPSSHDPVEMAEDGFKVLLNVYDLSQGVARMASARLIGKTIDGIWHTGVVVYGNEYFFGGGIQCVPAGTTQYGTPVNVVELGVTYLTRDVFEDYLREISPRYTVKTYNLFSHNCNNFSNEVAQFLVGSTIPDYIIALPNEILNSPMAPMLRPMFQLLESTVNAGGAPEVTQLIPPPLASQSSQVEVISESPSKSYTSQSSRVEVISQSPSRSDTPASNCPLDNSESDMEKTPETKNVVAPAVEPASKEEVSTLTECTVNDPLVSARNQVQNEITREFAALMASGTLRASEAAALATRKVMERYGATNAARG